MELAWLIPVFSFAAAPLIVVLGRLLPGHGSFLAILAIGGGFALFWLVFSGFLSASPDTSGCLISPDSGTLTCTYQHSPVLPRFSNA